MCKRSASEGDKPYSLKRRNDRPFTRSLINTMISPFPFIPQKGLREVVFGGRGLCKSLSSGLIASRVRLGLRLEFRGGFNKKDRSRVATSRFI